MRTPLRGPADSHCCLSQSWSPQGISSIGRNHRRNHPMGPSAHPPTLEIKGTKCPIHLQLAVIFSLSSHYCGNIIVLPRTSLFLHLGSAKKSVDSIPFPFAFLSSLLLLLHPVSPIFFCRPTPLFLHLGSAKE